MHHGEQSGPQLSISLTVSADYGQIYIYDPARRRDASRNPHHNVYLEALDDAVESGRFVGAASGVIDLMTPGQYNFKTPILLEIWPQEPPDDGHAWDHEVDVDIDIPTGTIMLEGAGGSGSTRAKVPPGFYRVRVSGRGFSALGWAGSEGSDSYRLRLWPRQEAAAALLRKAWPGWSNYR